MARNFRNVSRSILKQYYLVLNYFFAKCVSIDMEELYLAQTNPVARFIEKWRHLLPSYNVDMACTPKLLSIPKEVVYV